MSEKTEKLEIVPPTEAMLKATGNRSVVSLKYAEDGHPVEDEDLDDDGADHMIVSRAEFDPNGTMGG